MGAMTSDSTPEARTPKVIPPLHWWCEWTEWSEPQKAEGFVFSVKGSTFQERRCQVCNAMQRRYL
jgi:hypothetical protein